MKYDHLDLFAEDDSSDFATRGEFSLFGIKFEYGVEATPHDRFDFLYLVCAEHGGVLRIGFDAGRFLLGEWERFPWFDVGVGEKLECLWDNFSAQKITLTLKGSRLALTDELGTTLGHASVTDINDLDDPGDMAWERHLTSS